MFSRCGKMCSFFNNRIWEKLIKLKKKLKKKSRKREKKLISLTKASIFCNFVFFSLYSLNFIPTEQPAPYAKTHLKNNGTLTFSSGMKIYVRQNGVHCIKKLYTIVSFRLHILHTFNQFDAILHISVSFAYTSVQ